jgi:methylmalonyl-CoA mutase cobalamin-binding domain/chain
MTIFKKVKDLMNENDMADILLTGGGIIPDEDMQDLNNYGVGTLFKSCISSSGIIPPPVNKISAISFSFIKSLTFLKIVI